MGVCLPRRAKRFRGVCGCEQRAEGEAQHPTPEPPPLLAGGRGSKGPRGGMPPPGRRSGLRGSGRDPREGRLSGRLPGFQADSGQAPPPADGFRVSADADVDLVAPDSSAHVIHPQPPEPWDVEPGPKGHEPLPHGRGYGKPRFSGSRPGGGAAAGLADRTGGAVSRRPHRHPVSRRFMASPAPAAGPDRARPAGDPHPARPQCRQPRPGGASGERHGGPRRGRRGRRADAGPPTRHAGALHGERIGPPAAVEKEAGAGQAKGPAEATSPPFPAGGGAFRSRLAVRLKQRRSARTQPSHSV
jgi:hypothetical protein